MSDRSLNYRGVVDMGSNGIRFSITDLNPDVGAGLPTLYVSRAAISLYDAQFSSTSTERQPIPPETIDRVASALKRFQNTCYGFGLRDEQIQILATEATRVAPNSDEFITRLKEATGGKVGLRLLAKEDEGRIGAMGVASSLPNVQGLMMDLGGGSTQLSWLDNADGNLSMPPTGSVSMPYGAAALNRRIKSAGTDGNMTIVELRDEIVAALRGALKKLEPIPATINDQMEKRLANLYVSGGGLRGWGFILMSMHPVQPYPIPIINGFKVDASAFFTTTNVQAAVEPRTATHINSEGEVDIFRVSERRASQVPAVAFLVQCLEEVLGGAISSVHFCQGGVREGFLYQEIPSTSRQIPALWQACASASNEAKALLWGQGIGLNDSLAMPFKDVVKHYDHFRLPQELAVVPQALLLLSQLHGSLLKDIRGACALRTTTTGALAAAHGVSHFQRAALGLALCERWGGRGGLSPTDVDFYDRLQQLLSADAGPQAMSAWWCIVIGRLGAVIAEYYPAGEQGSSLEKLRLQTEWKWASHHEEIILHMKFSAPHHGLSNAGLDELIWRALYKLERCGKKKNWPGGYGYKFSLKIMVDGKECKVPKKTSLPGNDDDD